MKILFLGDFCHDDARFLMNKPRTFCKGFVRNGNDVKEFSYRNILFQLSPINSKKWAIKLAKKKVDRLLIKIARHYQPDLVFISTYRLLDSDTIMQVKEAVPKAKFMFWYSDHLSEVNPLVSAITQYCDWFISTSGGNVLKRYKQLGIPHCAFMPIPCDRDIEYPRQVPARWHSSILFTGKLIHGSKGQDPMRRELIEYLVKKKDMTVWGCLNQPKLDGLDYIHAICGAEMALSINAYNNARFYHSNRITNYLSCGTFVLAKYVPESELLFENNVHLSYFNSQQECIDLIDRFQADATLRKKIAEQGMRRVHEAFNCEKLAAHIIDLVETGEYKETWAEII